MSGLSNYWRIDSTDLNTAVADIYGNKALFKPSGDVSLVPDRFNNPSSAIFLNGGYINAPPHGYFGDSYTITFWVNSQNVELTHAWQFFLSFLNNGGLQDDYSIKIGLATYNLRLNIGAHFDVSDISNFENNVWYHTAYSIDGTQATLYINGHFYASGYVTSLNGISTNVNTFGSPIYPCYAILDDIKIFNRALNKAEIANEVKTIGCY